MDGEVLSVGGEWGGGGVGLSGRRITNKNSKRRFTP